MTASGEATLPLTEVSPLVPSPGSLLSRTSVLPIPCQPCPGAPQMPRERKCFCHSCPGQARFSLHFKSPIALEAKMNCLFWGDNQTFTGSHLSPEVFSGRDLVQNCQ